VPAGGAREDPGNPPHSCPNAPADTDFGGTFH